jgi:NADPH:quinone reductase
VSNEAKARVVAEAGASVIIKRIMRATEGRGVDRISEVDFGGNLQTTLAVMRQSCAIGAYASKGVPEPVLPFYPLLFDNTIVRFIQCSLMPAELRAAAMGDLQRWCEADALRHLDCTVLPIEDVASAHELVEGGAVIGKVLLELP